MVNIPPIFTFPGRTEWSHLYISLAKLAVHSNKRTVASLVVEFEISWLPWESSFSFSWKWHGRMVAISPIFTFPEKNEWLHLYIGLAEIAAYSNKRIVASLVVEFEIPLVFKKPFGFSFSWKWHRIMVLIPPIFAFPEQIKWFHLYISLVELAVSSNLYIVVSLVIQFEISLVFKSHLLGSL